MSSAPPDVMILPTAKVMGSACAERYDMIAFGTETCRQALITARSAS